MDSSFFILGPITTPSIPSSYNLYLVALSYFIASFASYVALDITEKIQANDKIKEAFWWIILGAFAMGSGIWTMHFIGMLAFVMPMQMTYNLFITLLSLIFAVIASGIAFSVVKSKGKSVLRLLIGGIFMGGGIALMHYTGMAAMQNMTIRYMPGLFFLSIIIAVLTSDAALFLMMKSQQEQFRNVFKVCSALIMGAAICGMHYTGMAAAVFSHDHSKLPDAFNIAVLYPDTLSMYIAIATILILSTALTASKSWTKALQSQNLKLIETEIILQQNRLELQKANQDLRELAKNAQAKEERNRMILHATADGMIVMDAKGTIEMCNPSAQELIGLPLEYILSHNITTFINSQSTLNLTSFVEPLDTIRESFVKSHTKGNVPIEFTLSQSLIDNRSIYIIVFRDISARKAAEEKLAAMHKALVETARRAGMADVATSVLHNIGNVLNNINICAQTLIERFEKFKIAGLVEISKRLNEGFKEEKFEEMLPNYLHQFSQYVENELSFARNELKNLVTKIDDIKQIVTMQQSLSKCSSMAEQIDVQQIMQEAVDIHASNIEKYGITIEKNYESVPFIFIDRVKIAQIFVNLIKNAMEAVIERNDKNKKISIFIQPKEENYIQIKIVDNGKGIKPEDLTEIFSFGFTTKKDGHGFGLHASALSAQEAGGSLKAHSLGLNQGAEFILILPIQKPNH